MIVVDINVVTHLLLPGPKTSLGETLLLDHPQWATQALCRSEWRNALTTYLRRDLLNLPAAVALMQKTEAILSAHDEHVSSEHVLELATRSGSAPLSGVTREVLCPFLEGEQEQSGDDCVEADCAAPSTHYRP